MFDQDLALLLAKASSYVYDFDAGRLPDLGNPAVQQFQDGGLPPTSFAALLTYDDKRLLAFQGTITETSLAAIKDWLADFRANLVKSPPELPALPGKIHEGFGDQLASIYPQLREALRAADTPVNVTGHSQGAAVAVLATKALELDNLPIAATYTFAAPRAGDAEFAQSVTTPVCRLEYGDDIVPHVPLQLPKLGLLEGPFRMLLAKAPLLMSELLATASKQGFDYRSVGPLTYAPTPDDLRIDLPPADERRLYRERVFRLLMAGTGLFEDHQMGNYLGMVGTV